MRRRTTAAAVSLVLGFGLIAAVPAMADEPAQPGADQTAPGDQSDADQSLPLAPTADAATEALATADRVLDGEADIDDPSMTLALRDLRAALPRLDDEDRDYAESILARPSDGAGDIYGNGYERPPETECQATTCVHWIPRSLSYQDDDEVGSVAYRETVQTVVEQNLVTMTDELGYRKPIPDGNEGGNAKFDVYLADLDSGLYGYCAPEEDGDTSYAFCVLDNDYAETQFAGQSPTDNMRVTAAHELFHAVQFAYDSWEDYWLMESTATWMEERLADDVNDNRTFLRYGQLGNPQKSLDVFEQAGAAQYGNWAFFESISDLHGLDSVRQIWTDAGAYRGAGQMFSAQAIESYLSTDGRGGFRPHFGTYVAQNSIPALNYSEGSAYDSQPLVINRTLSPYRQRFEATSYQIQHLSARTLRLKPAATMTNRWRLRINVDLPARKTGSEAVVLVRRKDRSSFVRRISLDRSGRGSTAVAMDDREIAWVNVSLVNASTRYQCWRGTNYSCQGRSRDDQGTYTVWAKAYRTNAGNSQPFGS